METVSAFKHPNMNGFMCPICDTQADEPVILVPIPGTEDGNICQANQIHSECYQVFMKMRGIEVTIINRWEE